MERSKRSNHENVKKHQKDTHLNTAIPLSIAYSGSSRLCSKSGTPGTTAVFSLAASIINRRFTTARLLYTGTSFLLQRIRGQFWNPNVTNIMYSRTCRRYPTTCRKVVTFWNRRETNLHQKCLPNSTSDQDTSTSAGFTTPGCTASSPAGLYTITETYSSRRYQMRASN